MQVTILTLPFDPATGGLCTEPLDALRRRCEVLRVQPAFFTHQEIAYWTLVVTHRVRAAPEEAAVRRGVERTTLPACAAVPGGSVAGAPSMGGDSRSDLRGGPRGDPQGDLLSAADAALYQELRVWRAEVADAAGIPVFMILTNRQLRDIVRLRPASLAALGGISGIGQARRQKYGPARVAPVHGPRASAWPVHVSGGPRVIIVARGVAVNVGARLTDIGSGSSGPMPGRPREWLRRVPCGCSKVVPPIQASLVGRAVQTDPVRLVDASRLPAGGAAGKCAGDLDPAVAPR